MLHQLVIRPVTVHNVIVLKCAHYITRITLNASQTGYAIASHRGFELSSPVGWDGFLLVKPSRSAKTLFTRSFFKEIVTGWGEELVQPLSFTNVLSFQEALWTNQNYCGANISILWEQLPLFIYFWKMHCFTKCHFICFKCFSHTFLQFNAKFSITAACWLIFYISENFQNTKEYNKERKYKNSSHRMNKSYLL